MPEILKPHEIPVIVRHTWDVWADGQWRRFYQDQDFPNQTPQQFYGAAKHWAARHELNLTGRVHPDRVELRMSPKETADDTGDATERPPLE